jgi:hypothetical protein
MRWNAIRPNACGAVLGRGEETSVAAEGRYDAVEILQRPRWQAGAS